MRAEARSWRQAKHSCAWRFLVSILGRAWFPLWSEKKVGHLRTPRKKACCPARARYRSKAAEHLESPRYSRGRRSPLSRFPDRHFAGWEPGKIAVCKFGLWGGYGRVISVVAPCRNTPGPLLETNHQLLLLYAHEGTRLLRLPPLPRTPAQREQATRKHQTS